MNDRRDDPVAAASTERRGAPMTAVEAADLEERYTQMLALAAELDGAGEQLRAWAEAGHAILAEPDVADSAPLSTATWATAEQELRAALDGPSGLLRRAEDLDVDATALRATVHTYRWIDDLQAVAYATLGTIAGRAIGYLAPEVELGGEIVAAGLIETDTLDRDGIAAFLGDLATANPDLMEHVTTGGGLAESLLVRGLLTAPALAGEQAEAVRRGGLRAIAVPRLPARFSSALRDAAVALPDAAVALPDAAVALPGAAATLADAEHDLPAADLSTVDPPRGLGELVERLVRTPQPVAVQPVGGGRAIVYLPGPDPLPGSGRHLRLVAGDLTGYADDVVRHLEEVLIGSSISRVLLAGTGPGGVAAIDIATRTTLSFVVEEVVTTSAPTALVPALPAGLPVLALEDRNDPVALLGSLVNASSGDRITIVYDAEPAAGDSAPGAGPVAGAHQADRAPHAALRATYQRWRERGYLGS
ncbi:hypothetical protein [Nocardioides sambongensis]|uniref:hypothetical protein n=1 Tax=Nocardioides sambongensis TaxID=2589074 RepID=UPI00112805F8|nr:hypothetical protein [Nocardioides sambongensis]